MALDTQCCVSLEFTVSITLGEMFVQEASTAQYRAVHSVVFQASVASRLAQCGDESMWVLNSDDFFSGRSTDHCVEQDKFLRFYYGNQIFAIDGNIVFFCIYVCTVEQAAGFELASAVRNGAATIKTCVRSSQQHIGRSVRFKPNQRLTDFIDRLDQRIWQAARDISMYVVSSYGRATPGPPSIVQDASQGPAWGGRSTP